MKNIELSVMQHQHIPHRDCFILSDMALLENTKNETPIGQAAKRNYVHTKKTGNYIYEQQFVGWTFATY
jgi:hypothetical protein